MTLSPISQTVPRTLFPPTAATQAGASTGGGLLDSITGGAGAQQAPKDDGSVGLFDGVFKKALVGGAVGLGIGILPLPGGPILGGIVGALVGAGYGIFKNFKEMKAIREENAAFLAAAGVQVDDPAVAEALVQGNPQQLLQMPAGGVPQQGGVAQQTGIPTQQTGIPTQQTGQVGQSTGQTPPPVVDQSTTPGAEDPSDVTPKQAELAQQAGGGQVDQELLAQERKKREDRIVQIWLQASDAEKEQMIKQLQYEISAANNLVSRLAGSGTVKQAA